MEPSKETNTAAAEADRDLMDFMARANQFMEDAPGEREKAINEGDIEKAQKIDNAIKSMNETMGMIRFHPFNSRFGQAKGVPSFHHDVRSDAGKFSGRGSQGHFLGYLARMGKAKNEEPIGTGRPGLQLKSSKKNPMIRRWQGMPKLGVAMTQKKLVDAIPGRPLTGKGTKLIASAIPGARHVPYAKVPNLDKMHAKMGVTPGEDTKFDEYKNARDRAFAAHGKKERIPIRDLTFTQGHYNEEKLAELHGQGHKDVHVTRTGGKQYLMNGHHRTVSDHQAGKEHVNAEVMDLDDEQAKEGTSQEEPQKETSPRERREQILRYLADYVPIFEKTMTHLNEIAGHFGKVKGRLKTPESLEKKMDIKKRDLDTITDVAGVRLTVTDMKSLEAARRVIEDNLDVKQTEDFITNEHPTGLKYRGLHFLFQVEGKVVELQLRTERQTKWAKWGHDNLYKGEYKNSPTFRLYANQLSDFLYAQDRGQQAEMPDCPPPVRKVDMCLEL